MTSVKKPAPVKDFQERGNECLKEEKYLEAVVNFTFAIKQDPRNADLYKKRSLAFLKTHQYYFALKDAEEMINLQPQRSTGLLAKAEVLFAAQRYSDAIKLFKEVLDKQPDDKNVMDKLKKSLEERTVIERQMQQLPWLGSTVGLLIGIIAVIFQHMSSTEGLKFPIIQVLFILFVGIIGYGVALFIRNLMQSYRTSLLDKPANLFGNQTDEDI